MRKKGEQRERACAHFHADSSCVYMTTAVAETPKSSLHLRPVYVLPLEASSPAIIIIISNSTTIAVGVVAVVQYRTHRAFCSVNARPQHSAPCYTVSSLYLKYSTHIHMLNKDTRSFSRVVIKARVI